MSDKSNKYGYVGVDIPAQSFGNNKGVFNPAEINELVADNKWTQYGQLELIETQTASAVNYDFTDLGNYNVHLLTFNNVASTSTGGAYMNLRFSNDGGSTFETTNYQDAMQFMRSNGTFVELKHTTDNRLRDITPYVSTTDTGSAGNGYIYLYNLTDSTKYSFVTFHSSSYLGGTSAGANDGNSIFGSGVYTVAETINAIRFFNVNSNTNDVDSISLYGIRYS